MQTTKVIVRDLNNFGLRDFFSDFWSFLTEKRTSVHFGHSNFLVQVTKVFSETTRKNHRTNNEGTQ